MKRLLVVALILLALANMAVAFGQTGAESARQELDAATRAYRDGRFAEAEQHFRRALELDPEASDARLYLARAVQQQYRPGDATPENVAVAERAVEAYAALLGDERHGEDAYKATLFLYGQLKREEKVVELLTRHAEDPNLPGEKRAEAFVILASRQWQCSYEITERGENKTVERRPGKVVTRYKRPADDADFAAARTCADEGLRLSELALTLDPENVNGWTYKANLFREQAKLAEMEGDAARKEEYERHYAEARDNRERLGAKQGEPKGAAERPGDTSAAETARPSPPPTGAGRTVVPGGVLDGKALSKPQPPYPANAYQARATGSVAVRVVVDETGKVVEAVAMSGHMLLRPAAEAAARQARFAPTLLNGQPVKLKGILTYNFVLR